MTPRICFTACVVSIAAMLSLPISRLAAQVPPAPADAAPGDFAPPPVTEGMEVMTRGVVHEAFAEVVTDPKPGLVVNKRPPEAIEEVPPEFKPEEEGAIWVTGYWAWDDERDDFFWQSGVWRVPPPGMRWVAGYWNEVPGGWQWVSGFWLPVETEEIRYYAAPPASLEAGPTGPAPGDDYFWATGSWTYYDTGYRWQPGYWAPYQENWVWISPRYAWTPAGCVYLPGRWDYRLTRRGCLFAPVYFTQPVYLRPSYVYRPWCALNTPNLFVHLWVRPNYGHFYFGNYYGSNWGNWGVTPWCQYRPYRNCYDPVLTQLQCHYRQSGVNYIHRLDGWHNHYASNVSSRPPRTWNEQVRIVNKTNIKDTNVNITSIKQNILAVNLQDASKRKDLNVKFARLDGNAQKQAINLAKKAREVRQQRISVEKPAGLSPDLAKRDGNRGGASGRIDKPDGDKSGQGQRGERPRTSEQVRLKLPASTQVSDVVKQKENAAPPKLTGPKASGGTRTPPWAERDVIESRRGDDRGPMPSRPDRAREAKQPKVAVPTELPQVELPKTGRPQPKPNNENPVRQPRIETPRLQPRIEVPQPKVDVPKPQPKVELPKPQPRVELPRARVETPRERPQIKLDIPRPSPRMDPAPRVQVAPRVETQKPEAPKQEPRRGGENHPRGGRNKPE